jgi:hypothetical protein
VTGQWQELGKAWLGNGVTDGPARVEGRVQWHDEAPQLASSP